MYVCTHTNSFPSFLQTLKVFERYPEDILYELSRYTLYDTFLTNITCESLPSPPLPSPPLPSLPSPLPPPLEVPPPPPTFVMYLDMFSGKVVITTWTLASLCSSCCKVVQCRLLGFGCYVGVWLLWGLLWSVFSCKQLTPWQYACHGVCAQVLVYANL